jgi:thiol-disulfide isomerase/thioredoxin
MAVVAAACSGGSAADPVADPARTDGEPVPAVSFERFDGTPTTLEAFVGRPLVVNFWASWCPSCVAEMSAAFRPVQTELSDRVTFLGMNIQDERHLALELLEETGVQWISAEDPHGELYAALGGLGMPFTVFVTGDGHIVERHNGPLTETQLRDLIETELVT